MEINLIFIFVLLFRRRIEIGFQRLHVFVCNCSAIVTPKKALFHVRASSETQGQLVGSLKCSWLKFTVRSRRAPGHLLLPNQFQKRWNCLLLMPGDSRDFLHDVVFLIDRPSCVALSTGKVSRRKFQNKMLTTRKITTFCTATRNKHSPMNF